MNHFNLESNNFLDVSLCKHINYSQAELESENGDNSIFPCSSQNEIPIFYEETPKLREIKTNEKEEERLYFIDKSKDIENKSFFKCIKEEEKRSKNRFELKKKRKRGRPKTINKKDQKYDKIHDKNQTDNLLRKIKVHYFSFIILFLNDILKSLKYKRKFLQLNYEYKSNTSKDIVKSLKENTIGEIICNKISSKYKYKDENSNKLLYDKIKGNIIMKKIFEIKYLKLFEIYYESNKIISLEEYGINKEIILTNKVKMYNDLLQKEKFNEKDKKEIEKSIKKNFLYI